MTASARREILLQLSVAAFCLAVGAGPATTQPQAAPPLSKFNLSTKAYSDGDWIPVQYTCGDPNGASPGMQWSDPPQGTMSFALIFHDTDAAPMKGSADVTHWILWNIPATAGQLPDSIKPDTSPDGIVQGKNIRVASTATNRRVRPRAPDRTTTFLNSMPSIRN